MNKARSIGATLVVLTLLVATGSNPAYAIPFVSNSGGLTFASENFTLPDMTPGTTSTDIPFWSVTGEVYRVAPDQPGWYDNEPYLQLTGPAQATWVTPFVNLSFPPESFPGAIQRYSYEAGYRAMLSDGGVARVDLLIGNIVVDSLDVATGLLNGYVGGNLGYLEVQEANNPASRACYSGSRWKAFHPITAIPCGNPGDQFSIQITVSSGRLQIDNVFLAYTAQLDEPVALSFFALLIALFAAIRRRPTLRALAAV